MSDDASYLQSRVVVDQALTIRFTDAASSATVDVSLSEDQTFDSIDALAAHLQTQIQAQGGNFNAWTVVITKEDETHLGSVKPAGTFKITTNHAGSSVNFNQGGAGTGTNLRTFLGHSSDNSGVSSTDFYFNSKIDACFYPSRGFLNVTRTRTEMIAMQHVTLGGHVNTQANIDTNLFPFINLNLSIQFNTEEDFSEISEFETFFDTVFDNDLSGEPFSIFQDGDSYVGGLAGGYPVFAYSRIVDSYDGAWRVDLTVETWSDVE